MKKSADKLAIAYVIILSLIPVLALPNLIFQSHVLDAIPYDASALTTELGFFLSNLPAIIYIMVLYILGILNIWKSFSIFLIFLHTGCGVQNICDDITKR